MQFHLFSFFFISRNFSHFTSFPFVLLVNKFKALNINRECLESSSSNIITTEEDYVILSARDGMENHSQSHIPHFLGDDSFDIISIPFLIRSSTHITPQRLDSLRNDFFLSFSDKNELCVSPFLLSFFLLGRQTKESSQLRGENFFCF